MKNPKLCKQKSGGDRAYVKINGVKIHLGKWVTPEAVEKYNRTIAEWNTTKQVPVRKGTVFTINELALEFLKHAKEHYLYPSGKPTPWASEFRSCNKITLLFVLNRRRNKS